MDKEGVIRIKHDEPVTVLASYFEATGRSKIDLEQSLDPSRATLYKAIRGDACSKNFATEVERETGLDKALVAFMEKRAVWCFRLLGGDRVKVIRPDQFTKVWELAGNDSEEGAVSE